MISENKTFLITSPEQILHMVGVYAEGYLLIGKTNLLITDKRYYYAVNEKLKGSNVLVKVGDITTLIDELKAEKVVYCDYSLITVNLFNKLKEIVEVKDCQNQLNEIIAIKSKAQLENIKKACEICQQSFLATLPYIKVGVSELEIASKIEFEFKNRGASGTSFETIVAFGANSAVPHHQTSNKKLENDSVILMDFGCKVNGYCSDMTRTMFFGNPTEKFLVSYDKVKNAHIKAKEQIRAGLTAREGDKISRDYLVSENLSEFFTHSLGHGIGTLIHEYPSISPKCDYVLKNGNVFSIEPGVYFDGEFGIRIEDTVYLENDKVKSFMTDSLDLKILK